MKLFLVLVPLLTLHIHHCQASAQQNTDGLNIETQQGPVIGSLVTPTVRRFAGIPFATAKRWQVPQVPPKRKSRFDATRFGDSCIQQLTPFNVEYLILTNTLGINVTESEDCMTVNIWTPSISRKQKTAVMIWIYGGEFAWGTSNVPMYDGQNMVRDNDDLTVVSFNYRLNIFGQPGAPQLGENNVNFGLLDIRAAVQWVHANIANFGGDPDRIVLFGQSAGAAAADAYVFANPHDTIVKGVILQSGSITGIPTFVNAPPNDGPWNIVAAAVGCGSIPNADQFACMQKIHAMTLENAILDNNALFSFVADNVTVFLDTLVRAATGNFLQVPVLVGTTANEDDIFMVSGELVSAGFTVPVLTGVISDLITLSIACSSSQSILFRVNASTPAWRYEYQAIFPGISVRQDLRAFHSSEIQSVFGTYNNSTPQPSSTLIELSKYIQSAWVTFARNPTQGLVSFGWPLYNPNTMSLIQLGGITDLTGAAFAQGNLTDVACADQETLAQIQTQLSGLLPS